jgi:hypothetical protein
VPLLTNAILPLVADILIVVLVRSAVKVPPSEPALPSLTRKYLPGPILVLEGKVMMAPEAPKLPVAEPYCRDMPVIVTVIAVGLNNST